MKGLMILTNGVEDVEAVATIDVLRRAQVRFTCATLKSSSDVITSLNNHLVFEEAIKDLDYKEFDFLILPGGPAVMKELDKSPKVDEIVKYFCDNNLLVCAICAAPLLIGKHGYFKGLNYTCFPGCDESILEGTRIEAPLVHEGNYITARSMYYACDFALEIVSALKGNEKAIEIAKQIKGL